MTVLTGAMDVRVFVTSFLPLATWSRLNRAEGARYDLARVSVVARIYPGFSPHPFAHACHDMSSPRKHTDWKIRDWVQNKGRCTFLFKCDERHAPVGKASAHRVLEGGYGAR
jgi:hypothetical protein